MLISCKRLWRPEVHQHRMLGVSIVLSSMLWILGAAQAAADPCSNQAPAATLEPTGANDSIPFGKGLLWKIERPGGEPSYLFGTLHVENSQVVELPQPVRNAFSQARSFTTEVVMHPAARASYAKSIRLPANQTLREYLDEGVYDRLVKISQESYQISEEILSSLKPWVVFTYLSRPRPVTGRTLDAILEELAIKQRKAVDGLETIEEIVNALDTMPMDDQIAILKDSVCNHSTIATQWNQLIELYLQRDLAGLVALNEQPHHDEAVFKALMERTLYRRNRRMAERMEAPLKKGGAFIGVGALHLPGEQGLLSLLQARGYHVSLVF